MWEGFFPHTPTHPYLNYAPGLGIRDSLVSGSAGEHEGFYLRSVAALVSAQRRTTFEGRSPLTLTVIPQDEGPVFGAIGANPRIPPRFADSMRWSAARKARAWMVIVGWPRPEETKLLPRPTSARTERGWGLKGATRPRLMVWLN